MRSVIGILLAVTVLASGCDDALNCNEGELASELEKGRVAATTQESADIERGTREGAALTETQGFNEAYTPAYNQGYTAGYNFDYWNGYDFTYGTDLPPLNGADACTTGDNDGYNYGYTEYGIPNGRFYGYEDGYAWGEYDGWPAGEASCLRGESGSPSASDKTACYNRGYADKHNPKAYTDALAAAKIANTNYTRGLENGDAAGYSEGYNPGRNAGYNDGGVAGTYDRNAYLTCYDPAFDEGYDAGYTAGYYDTQYGYGNAPVFYFNDGTGGYGHGYADGFCGGRYSMGCTVTNGCNGEYAYWGTSQSWAQNSPTHPGVRVANFATKPMPNFLTKEKQSALSARISVLRQTLKLELRQRIRPAQF